MQMAARRADGAVQGHDLAVLVYLAHMHARGVADARAGHAADCGDDHARLQMLLLCQTPDLGEQIIAAVQAAAADLHIHRSLELVAFYSIRRWKKCKTYPQNQQNEARYFIETHNPQMKYTLVYYIL